MTMKLGFKASFDVADKIGAVKGFDYSELYFTPEYMRKPKPNENWEVVHAPHGGNTSVVNTQRIVNSLNLAHQLNSKYLIMHSGIYPVKKEDKVIPTIREIVRLADKTGVEVLLENMFTFQGNHSASSLKELEKIIKETGCGFMLDFAHAYYYSKEKNMNEYKLIHDLLKLKPKMYHMSDGFKSGAGDGHLALGKGDLNIQFYLKVIGSGMCTLEINPPTERNLLESKALIDKLKSDG